MPIRFARSARIFLRSQASAVASRLIGECVLLASNPYLDPDDPRKSLFLAPPAVMRIYRVDEHWIIYYEEHGNLIIANIGSVLEKPHLWRQG